MENINDPDRLIQACEEVLVVQGTYILVTRWLSGSQPIERDRHRIPEFFGGLARLNLRNTTAGTVTSMYLDGRHYGTLEEFLDAELESLLSVANIQGDHLLYREAAQPLKHGQHRRG